MSGCLEVSFRFHIWLKQAWPVYRDGLQSHVCWEKSAIHHPHDISSDSQRDPVWQQRERPRGPFSLLCLVTRWASFTLLIRQCFLSADSVTTTNGDTGDDREKEAHCVPNEFAGLLTLSKEERDKN